MATLFSKTIDFDQPFQRFFVCEKMHLVFWNFLIWATDTEIYVKNGVWGPVEWVGDQLTGWGGSSQKQNSKIKPPCFFIFFYLSDRYRDICKKLCLGTSWMGWGPVDWVNMVLPEAKLKNKTTLFFEIFWFERPIARYLLKTILHCKGSRIWGNAITEVAQRSQFCNFHSVQRRCVSLVALSFNNSQHKACYSGKQRNIATQ